MGIPISWRPGMVIDGGILDEDHRHLIDIVNSFQRHDELGRLALSRAVESLHALKFYAQTHFEREEHLQCLVTFPEYREQEGGHRELVAALDNLIWRAERPVTYRHAGTIVEEFAQLLRRWILHHVIGHDLKMKPYAAAMRRYERDLAPLKSVRRFGGPTQNV